MHNRFRYLDYQMFQMVLEQKIKYNNIALSLVSLLEILSSTLKQKELIWRKFVVLLFCFFTITMQIYAVRCTESNQVIWNLWINLMCLSYPIYILMTRIYTQTYMIKWSHNILKLLVLRRKGH